MKKFITIFVAVLLCIALLFLTFATASIFLKSPMMLSGYSSLLTSHFNSRLVVLGLLLLLICIIFFKYGKYGRGLLKFNLLLSLLFFVGQLAFFIVMLFAAKKYNTHVSLFKTLKSYENAFKSSETYSYLTFDGEKQLLDVYRPQTKSSHPSIPVILVHGGGFIEGNRTQVGYAAEWFTDRGYTVFAIDYPLGKDNRQTWESAVNSLVTSMGFVKTNAKKFNVDPNKIILVGGSAGGALVMQADIGIRNKFAKSYDSVQVDSPAAVIAIYPPVNLTALWDKMVAGKTVDLKDAARKYIGGSPSQFPQRYAQLDLIDHLSKGISPTLIVTGEIDHVVNVEATRTFVEKTQAMKLPVTYVEVPYGEHVFDANSNSISGQIEWQNIGAFLKKNNLENR